MAPVGLKIPLSSASSCYQFLSLHSSVKLLNCLRCHSGGPQFSAVCCDYLSGACRQQTLTMSTQGSFCSYQSACVQEAWPPPPSFQRKESPGATEGTRLQPWRASGMAPAECSPGWCLERETMWGHPAELWACSQRG